MMKKSTVSTARSTQVCLIEGHSKAKFVTRQSLMMASLFVGLVFSAWNVNADQLWNNGDTDGSATLGWGQSSSILDDFYVPGGGWWINHVETIGIFVDPSTVDEVEVAIWPHDMEENGPNGDAVDVLTVTNVETTPTGRTFFDREEIKISVDFDNTYLKGQRYYWIEITVRDPQGIQDFRLLARQGISHEPSWTHFGGGSLSSSSDVYGNDLDLSYALYGNPVESRFDSPVGGFKVEDSDGRMVIGVNKIATSDVKTLNNTKLRISETRPNADSLGFAIRCPAGTTLTPFEMPIYDDATGLWVVGHETVWYCISDDNIPAG